MKRFSARFAVALVTSSALGLSAASAQTATPPADPTPPPTATPPAEPAAPTASAPTTADPAAPQTATPSAGTQTITVGDKEIRSFAMALVEVDQLQRQYAPRIQEASPEQRPAIEQEANARMTQVVEAQGIDAPTFNAISATAQENPELHARIQQELARVQPTPAQ